MMKIDLLKKHWKDIAITLLAGVVVYFIVFRAQNQPKEEASNASTNTAPTTHPTQPSGTETLTPRLSTSGASSSTTPPVKQAQQTATIAITVDKSKWTATPFITLTLAPYYTIVPTKQYTSTVNPQRTITAPPRPSATATVPPPNTATPQIVALGLSQTDVKNKLEQDKGFSCNAAIKQDVSTLTCDYKTTQNANRVLYNVESYGRSETSVLYVYANVLQSTPDNNSVADVFGYLAQMPFGQRPDLAAEARTWVINGLQTIQNTNEDRWKTIGGIEYRLYGASGSWFLEIGDSTF